MFKVSMVPKDDNTPIIISEGNCYKKGDSHYYRQHKNYVLHVKLANNPEDICINGLYDNFLTDGILKDVYEEVSGKEFEDVMEKVISVFNNFKL